jgi:nickel-dependent lactate racemase
MQIRLDYGRKGLLVEVPEQNLDAVLGLNPAPPVPDPSAAVQASLANPISSPPLAELARGRRSACVVISDITRPVPNRVLLPPLLGCLEASGITREQITILVATGTHRPNTPEELDEMVGPAIAREYRIVNHAARDPETHERIGTGRNGTPFEVDRRFLEAELRITTALIEPHFMAGFSGGRKSVCPGICSLETVKTWHGPHFIGHPRSEAGVLEGNPLHEDGIEAARLAGTDFILDVALDEERRITGVFAGDLEAAWYEGVRHVERVVQAKLEAPADVVLTTSAGYPLDLTYYQAVKGMVGALPAVKEGGTIVLAARCAEGLGSREFAEALLNYDDIEAFVNCLYEPGFFVPDQWEVQELAKARRKAEVLCFSEGIDAGTLARCFVEPIPSAEAGVRQALDRHGPGARLAVIPKGPYVVPVVASG